MRLHSRMQALTYFKIYFELENKMRDTNRPNLEDVAVLAGVSTASISRCINNPKKVAEPTRLRIQKAIDSLGYMPHFGGRALAINRTNTVGAIIPSMENAVFASGLQAFQETLNDSKVTLLVGSSNYNASQEYDQIRSLLSQGADGLLLIGKDRPKKTLDFLEKHSVPHVLAWCFGKNISSPVVGFDNQKAAQKIANHVIALGHRKLAIIAGLREGNDRANERIIGIEDAQKTNANVELVAIEECKYSFEEASAALDRILALNKNPTAIICSSDVLAVGAMLRAKELGLSVPNDISITGFDDINLARVVTPSLTTVRVPQQEMGRKAAEVLLDLINPNLGKTAAQSVELTTTIINRGTLASR